MWYNEKRWEECVTCLNGQGAYTGGRKQDTITVSRK